MSDNSSADPPSVCHAGGMIQRRLFTGTNRQFQALTGLSRAEFAALLPAFATAYHDQVVVPLWQGRTRRRQPGGGRRGYVPRLAERFAFILLYVRQYPTQDLLAALFGMSQPQANYWVLTLLPVLQATLGQVVALPLRPATATMAALQAQCAELTFLLDATERPVRRPKDDARQRAHYSGKKKRHTVKNTLLTNAEGSQILLVGRTATGNTHDKTLAVADAIPYPADSVGAGDLGYQGHAPPDLTLVIPIKKPRGGDLTEEERALNTRLAQLRIPVEHAIRGLKISRIAAEVFRNTKAGLVDSVAEIATGLYNWKSRQRGHVTPVAA